MGEAPDGRRVLIVSAAMGGGHLQISRELQRRLSERGHQVVVADLLRLMPPPTGRWLHWVYPWLVNRAPRLYQWIYETFFLARQRAGERAGVPVRLALPGLRRLVRRFRPDVAVSTYPLAALALGRLRERGELGCPAITVITTFSVNNLWIHPGADLELCISPEAAADASGRAGRPAQVCGPVIRPGFTDVAAERSRVRRELGVPPDARAALVTTGSVGLAGSAEQAAGVIAGHPGWAPIVVCGHNEALRVRLDAFPGVVAVGWTDDMPAMMSAADVLVDNAGGMSSKEALGVGLPIVTFRPLAGHGRDDADALARLGLTDVVTDEHGLLRALDLLTGDPKRYRDRVARGRALFVDDAAAVVESIAEGSPAGHTSAGLSAPSDGTTPDGAGSGRALSE